MKTSVRFLLVLFALVMAMFTVAYAADYSDLKASHENYEAVETLTTLKILGGYDDGTFKPDANVERDEMAKMIFIMATSFYDAGQGEVTFPDVASNHWASGFISWCYGKEIVGGYEDGTFRADNNITYDEALKMTAAMLGFNDFDPEKWPADVRTVALKQLNLGENIPETVTGSTPITRAQAAQIIFNAFYKTMNTTKTVTYYEDGYVEADGITAARREVKVEVPMTLAADVWNCTVSDYVVVATESFGLNHIEKGINVRKTGLEDTIVLWDGSNTLPVDLEEWGLDEYEGNTDEIFGFTLTHITKDGENFAVSGIKGAKYSSMPLSYVKASIDFFPDQAFKTSDKYCYKDRMRVNGTVYQGEDFENLRAAVIDTNGTFTIYDQSIWNYDNVSYAKADGTLNSNHVSGIELNFNHYVTDYNKTVWGIDSEGDGIIDYIFFRTLQPYKVTNVVDAVENGERYQLVTFEHLYDNAAFNPAGAIDSRNIAFAAGTLEKGDVFVGTTYADKLFVQTVVEPQSDYATAMSNSSITLASAGKVNGYCPFWNSLKRITDLVDVSNPSYWINKKADGTYNMMTLWIYNGYCIYSEDYAPEAETSHNKAILLYADKKTEEQLDKATNKFNVFYPAYLLINGKEEAVNLNPDNAIDGKSGDYVSADGSEYRAKINTSDMTLEYVYKLVTYTVDSQGYYTLSEIAEDIVDDEEDILYEKVIDVTDNPKLSYNEATGLYTIKTDSETLSRVDVSEETYLYYFYKKAITGDYVYIDFYTSDTLTGEKITDAEFASDVYLSYDEDTGFYVIQAAVLKEALDYVTAGEGVDYNKDGRAVYLAVTNSAIVAFDGAAHYEHTFMNPLTGETFTVVQEEISVTEGANPVEAGKFYAWDDTEEDYVRVTSQDIDSVVRHEIESFDLTRGIIYMADGEYVDGIKLADDFVIVAFDDELNRYELTIDDAAAIKEIYDEETSDMFFYFITYLDENGDAINAYAIVDYAETLENADGERYNVLHDDATANLFS